MNPSKKEQRCLPQTYANRVFIRRDLTNPETRAERIPELIEERRNAKKILRDLQRDLEAERAKPKSQRDNNLIRDLQTRYNSASANQGAARRALDMTTSRFGRKSRQG